MLTLRGAPALSVFRLDKLAQKLSAIHPDIRLLHTEFVHFADIEGSLEDGDLQVLEKLLEYGPSIDEKGHVAEGLSGELRLVVPRPGTISPWSSKATDIAHNCGLLTFYFFRGRGNRALFFFLFIWRPCCCIFFI